VLVSNRNQLAEPSVLEKRSHAAAAIRGNDHQAGCKRLEDDRRNPLEIGREQKDIEFRQHRSRFGHIAPKDHAIGAKPETPGKGFEFRALRAIAEHRERIAFARAARTHAASTPCSSAGPACQQQQNAAPSTVNDRNGGASEAARSAIARGQGQE
jgi:hypothetical protein